ncbi:hypothetical protein HDE78_000242 [Rhodanobacter sp. K2T2]|uniref:hypothetical protein n=1 Tax=Rhodanobacter sp. K2T2 TaxID=2723085 RepID=UPI0015CA0E24|nr:hypothetical protein [Rhodanobacter sp. K2T2]NYE27317.1 hypothetical protein [Rhodanobacter sp. K2T2]
MSAQIIPFPKRKKCHATVKREPVFDIISMAPPKRKSDFYDEMFQNLLIASQVIKKEDAP